MKLLTNTKVCEQNDSTCSYDYRKLPDLVLEELFEQLDFKDLCRAGGTCKNWYRVSRSSIFWRRVDTKPLNLTYCKVQKFLRCLPSCVTHLRICCHHPLTESIFPTLRLPEISDILRRRCPHLQVLIFEDCVLLQFSMKNGNEGFQALEHLPRTLRVLSFRGSLFNVHDFLSRISDSPLPEIEVLDISNCSLSIDRRAVPLLSSLSHLKVLHLSKFTLPDEDVDSLRSVIQNLKVLDLQGLYVPRDTFLRLKQFGRSLTELYICDSLVGDDDLNFEGQDFFPRLEIICIRRTNVTRLGVGGLLESCQSLRHVYANHRASSRESFLELDQRTSEKVRYADNLKPCFHQSQFDYMCKY